jgi:hypothetical protein
VSRCLRPLATVGSGGPNLLVHTRWGEARVGCWAQRWIVPPDRSPLSFGIVSPGLVQTHVDDDHALRSRPCHLLVPCAPMLAALAAPGR